MSWWQLYDTIRAAGQLRREELQRPPQACPNDGTPLIPAPQSPDGSLFCPFDGWQYPRDDHRPDE